jgi:hypothetical protein
MISKLYIIEESGICRYYIDITDTDSERESNVSVNTQLISSLFSALLVFADESVTSVDTSSKVITYIAIKNVLFYFRKVQNLFIILETDEIDNQLFKDRYDDLLDQIVSSFNVHCRDIMNEMNNQLIRNTQFNDELRIYIEATNWIIEKNQLALLLHTSDNIVLSDFSLNKILAYEIIERGIILKRYYKIGFQTHIHFHEVMKFWKSSERFTDDKDQAREFYMQFENIWIVGLLFMDYYFLIALDSSIEIDQLKTQVMPLLEMLIQ